MAAVRSAKATAYMRIAYALQYFYQLHLTRRLWDERFFFLSKSKTFTQRKLPRNKNENLYEYIITRVVDTDDTWVYLQGNGFPNVRVVYHNKCSYSVQLYTYFNSNPRVYRARNENISYCRTRRSNRVICSSETHICFR